MERQSAARRLLLAGAGVGMADASARLARTLLAADLCAARRLN